MLGDSQLVAFAATKDPVKARAFYEHKLGLTFVADEQFALVFETGGTMLRVQKVQQLQPPQHTVLGWTVSDMDTTVRGLAGRGVPFARYSFLQQDDLGIWTAPNGTKVAWFTDPDGHILSLTQFVLVD